MPRTSPGATTTAPSGSDSFSLRHGNPPDSGSIANVPVSMSTGSWTPFPYL
ncbi:hypothetical protein QC281_33765 [Streptomyces sp. DH17]|nr:hypothetical protein [Streptomyces sp. DH17]